MEETNHTKTEKEVKTNVVPFEKKKQEKKKLEKLGERAKHLLLSAILANQESDIYSSDSDHPDDKTILCNIAVNWHKNHRMFYYRPDRMNDIPIWYVDGKEPFLPTDERSDGVEAASQKYAASVIYRWSQIVFDVSGHPFIQGLRLSNLKEAEDVLQVMMAVYPVNLMSLDREPAALGWPETPGLVLRRMPWSRIERMNITGDDWGAIQVLCPTWWEVLNRMSNRRWFCWRIGSLFDPDADRKQAAFIHGPKDSGKSRIQAWIDWLCGKTHLSAGAQVMKSGFWKHMTIGKRAITITEAHPEFLQTEDFKSLTGDDRQLIDRKRIDMVYVKVNFMLFFFSNHKPVIPDLPEIRVRVAACDLGSLPEGTELIPAKDYDQKLIEESQRFVSWCVDLYESAPRRMEPEFTPGMEEGLEQFAEGEWAVFHQLFRFDEEGWVSNSEVNRQLGNHVRKSIDLDKLLGVWRRNKKLRATRRESGGVTQRGTSGMSFRMTGNNEEKYG